MKKVLLILIVSILSHSIFAQSKMVLEINKAETLINKNIYGHFAEHLGRCVYDGLYVGDENKSIPNTKGVRNDVIEALKKLNIPNLRWPGGCFADTYHWKEAIGPKNERKPIQNIWWGNYREDNSFGTNEFLDLCETLGAEPYLALNMNTGSVQEAAEWVQYTSHANGTSYMTDLREKYGRAKPWKVKYWGIGNESWGCGGNMTVDYYLNLYKRYATALPQYSNENRLFRIAVGPGGEEQMNWTEKIMENVPLNLLEGISIHHYSVFNWSDKGSSFDFSDEEYFKTMDRAWDLDSFIYNNSKIMDNYDPDKKVALIVDEWGGWYETEPSGNGALYQENTIRDAMIAGLSLNIFNNHADRVKMANLAQTVNVLQALILTKEEKMILTPTYHVMEMYKVHQNATLIPLSFKNVSFKSEEKSIPAISASASIDENNKIHISITNIDNINSQDLEIDLMDFKAKKVSGHILTSEKVQDANTFENPNKITPQLFKDIKLIKNNVKVKIPKNSVLVIEIEK